MAIPSEQGANTMADRSLRGSRLGATSLEDDRDVELAPRLLVHYDCPDGHVTRVPMSAEADVPALWECRTCGLMALQRGGEQPEKKAKKPARTHWDMLLERRSIAELEELLDERLELLHGPARRTA
jgi:ribosomal protein L37AE/L43A